MTNDERRYHFHEAVKWSSYKVGQFTKFPLFALSMVLDPASMQSLFGDIYPKTAYRFIVKNDPNFITAIILGTAGQCGFLNKPLTLVENSFGLATESQPYTCVLKSENRMIEIKPGDKSFPGDGVFEIPSQCHYTPMPGTGGNVEQTVCLPQDTRVKIIDQAPKELTDKLLYLTLPKISVPLSGASPTLGN